jgi:hypothetical protein
MQLNFYLREAESAVALPFGTGSFQDIAYLCDRLLENGISGEEVAEINWQFVYNVIDGQCGIEFVWTCG